MVTELKRISTSILPVLGLFVLILGSLYFMSNAAQEPESFGQWYLGLLIFNAALLLVLFLLILVRITRLIRGFVTRAEGARLTWRLVLMFTFVAMVPVLIVYAFSSRFISTGIDNWFDVSIESSLEDALQLGRLSLDYRKSAYLREVEVAGRELADQSEVAAAIALNDYRVDLGADQLSLLGFNNRIIGTSSSTTDLSVPRFPSSDVLLSLSDGRNYVAIEPSSSGELHVRVVVRIVPSNPVEEPRVLLAVFALSDRVSLLAERVEQAYDDYRGLVFLRGPLKQSFSVTLLLVLLLTTLFALWAAFYMARRMLSPVMELAAATKAVTQGNYEQYLPVMQHDELGFLVQSFNQMTTGIRQAREIAERNQLIADNQRRYLETVLGNLSSGVLSLDENLFLRTANNVATRVFETGRPLRRYVGQHVVDIASSEPLFRTFYEQIQAHLESHEAQWQQEGTLFGEQGRKVLLSRGVALRSNLQRERGWVIVFDDVTALITAQRDAAWGEVARRLAHEIKNPLTPIQLSAERIEYRLADDLPPEKREILRKATRTIVQQVASMKDMVNEFRDYASAPKIELAQMNFNNLVDEVVELYRGIRSGVGFKLKLDRNLPTICVDAGQMRQVLHNFIKNALEAIQGESGRIEIATHFLDSAEGHYVEFSVSDSGSGIKPELLENLFEPYVTDKHKGTGLGLAIVKKIIEQHGGLVRAVNLPEGGASMIVRLPVRHTDHAEVSVDAGDCCS